MSSSIDGQVTDLLVRDVAPVDAGAIVAILNPIIEARVHTAFDAPFTSEAERDYIIGFPPRGVWKVALRRTDGRVVGFQVLEPFGPYTRAFDHVGTLGTYVDLDQRRHGVAKALFAATFESARRKGYEKIFTFVRADNAAALATYRAHGFEVIGTARRHAKIDGRYIDEILIEKALGAETSCVRG
jgi:L-amino acid N-acyltransferase YncA